METEDLVICRGCGVVYSIEQTTVQEAEHRYGEELQSLKTKCPICKKEQYS